MHSRINPTDDDETLDNRASRKRLARIATVNLVGQSCKGGDANKVENEWNGNGNKMGEKAKGSALAKKLEANRQNHCFFKKNCQLITMKHILSNNLQPHAVVHTLATSKILILSLYALVWAGG